MVKLPTGTSLATALMGVAKVEDIARKRSEVTNVFTLVGNRGTGDQAQIYAQLIPKDQRKLTDQEVAQAISDEAQHRLPGLQAQVRVIGMVAQGDMNFPVNIEVTSDDLDKLKQVSHQLMASLKQYPVFADVDSSLAHAKPELQLRIDRDRAAELGVTPAAIAQTLRLATIGDTTTTFTDGDFDYDERVRANPAIRDDLARLAALTVAVPGRAPVAIGAVTELKTAAGYSEITRQNRTRVVSVVANLRPGVPLGDGVGLAQKLASQIQLPPDVHVEFEGQAKDMGDTFTGLLQALALAIVFIYLILAVQFESFIHPFTIMASLPLSVIGAFLALWLTGTELGMMAMIGVIMLMGIVTKNAILIVDFTITLRQRGMSRMEALMHAGPIRLRPILMTTAAMVMGMLPMAFKLGAGSEFRYPMAIVVIGGLITSTFLTLLVVPVLYTVLDDVGAFVRRRLGFGESARIAGSGGMAGEGGMAVQEALPGAVLEESVPSARP